MFSAKNSKGVPLKVDENFHTSESDENCYLEVLGHQEHESGLSFIIIIILNTISTYYYY